MFSLLILSLPVFQEPAPDSAPAASVEAPESEAMAALRKRVAALGEAKSYAFRMLTTSENSGMGGGRGGFGGGANRQQRGGDAAGQDRPQRGGDASGEGRPQRGGDASGEARPQGQGRDADATAAQEPAAPQPWEGVYQTGKPVLMKRGELQVAKNADRMAMKTGEGVWTAMTMPGRGGQGRGQGGAQGRGGQGGFGNMDRTQLRALFEVRSVQLPHEALASILESIDADKLVREEKLGLVVFHGPLTEEAAIRLAMGGRSMRGRGGRGGNDSQAQGPIMLGKGTVRIAFAPDGKTIDLKIDAEMGGTFGETEFTASSKSEIRAAKIGEATMEIPAAATKALSTDPSLEEEF
jgi:hypothetical protein